MIIVVLVVNTIALTIVLIEACKKIKIKSGSCNSCDCNDDDEQNNNLISLK